ncbi:MAG: glycerol-3-phosphate 1-O-acyltransferase PlsY [Planctomycetaceae bacterium]
MTIPQLLASAVAASYLTGSMPFGYIIARFVAGLDIRQEGSGNIGATNIGRVLGAKWGILVLVLDCLKGLLPTLLLPWLLLKDHTHVVRHAEVACGIATVVGHMFPVWLKFRGGKGVATALGVALALGTWATLAAAGSFVIAVICFRIVSLSSIIAAIVFGMVQLVTLLPEPFSETQWSVAVFALFVPALIIFRHRANVIRLLRGEEKKFQFGSREKKATETSDSQGHSPPNDTRA